MGNPVLSRQYLETISVQTRLEEGQVTYSLRTMGPAAAWALENLLV